MTPDLGIFKENGSIDPHKSPFIGKKIDEQLLSHFNSMIEHYNQKIESSDASLKRIYQEGYCAFHQAVKSILDEPNKTRRDQMYRSYFWSYHRLNMGSAGGYERLDTITEFVLVASLLTFAAGIALLPLSVPFAIGLVALSVSVLAAFGTRYCFEQLPRELVNHSEERAFFKDLSSALDVNYNMPDLQDLEQTPEPNLSINNH